ncbi:hypothetical protein DFA_11708 [Cavenderia fasciculata]|uniref:Rab-GAP TBC domain-containing protein n=1 Tax=Cavenderia fasciculata TaxID=261658 RepID=F4QE00_CACFS|nr:uncharacterized protein DFA_11708 [Cavenderia fasciculata]EGG13947.1 hypothetical protein DFA_11708 [Cavenderia fasciculata]|eukprot:XP_004350655.1 hypothetical protein DFA_11708 [Cavenderia fasciculata]
MGVNESKQSSSSLTTSSSSSFSLPNTPRERNNSVSSINSSFSTNTTSSQRHHHSFSIHPSSNTIPSSTNHTNQLTSSHGSGSSLETATGGFGHGFESNTSSTSYDTTNSSHHHFDKLSPPRSPVSSISSSSSSSINKSQGGEYYYGGGGGIIGSSSGGSLGSTMEISPSTPRLEPEELMLFKLPILSPHIPIIKQDSLLDRIANIADKHHRPTLPMINVDPVERLLSSYGSYLKSTSHELGDKQESLNKKLKEMELLCSKGHQLMLKHVTLIKQTTNILPDINKLNQNIKETQMIMNNVLDTIERLTSILPNHDEELIEFSQSLQKSPINRPNFHFKEPSESNSILKNVTNIIKLKDKNSVWLDEIIPNMDKVRNTGRVKELARKGINDSIRGMVWQSAIGNKLNITLELYNELIEKSIFSTTLSEDQQNSLDQDQNQNNNNQQQQQQNQEVGGEEETYILPEDDLKSIKESIVYSFTMIEMDLPRTFTSLSLVNRESSEFRKQLKRVLNAYAVFDGHGYVQGMSYLASSFLLHMDEFQAFVCFANLLNNRFLQSLFQLNMREVDKYMKVFDKMFLYCLPKLHQHFEEIGLIPHYYLIQWWLTVFCQSLPLSVATRIWDAVVIEGNLFLFVAALGVLYHFRRQLEENNLEFCKNFLSNLPESLDPSGLFKSIENIDISYCSHTLATMEAAANHHEYELQSLSHNNDEGDGLDENSHHHSNEIYLDDEERDYSIGGGGHGNIFQRD